MLYLIFSIILHQWCVLWWVSLDKDQENILVYILPKRNATNKISVCAPNITFMTMARSPSLYVNDKELGKPSKNKNVIAYVAVGDEWEVTLKESIWDASSVADVEVISDQVKSSGDIFIIMARHNNWGGAIGILGSGSGNVIGSAVFGALGGAVNAKNEYTPFTASKVTKSEFSKKCPG